MATQSCCSAMEACTVSVIQINPDRQRLSHLLVGYLRGDAEARDRFPIEAAGTLAALARHHASFLSVDVREEVINEAHAILLSREPRFDPQRAPAHTYLRLIVRDAVKRVDARYRSPGRKSRQAKDALGHQRGAA